MKARILVVDDDASSRYMLRALLERHGFVVVEAGNGREALAIGRREIPDAVITDLMMPEMDGYAFCRAWLAAPELRDKPLIVYSATYTDPEDRKLALDLGAAMFLDKPLEPDELIRAVLDAMGRSADAGYVSAGMEEEEFVSRHTDRLQARLHHKIEQLASARQALADYVSRTEAFLEASPDAIISMDPEFRVRSWNAAAERLLGYTEAEVIGRHVGFLVPETLQERIMTEIHGAQSMPVRNRETLWVHKNGRLLDLSVSVSYLGDGIGSIAVGSDRSVARRVEEERKRLEDQLALSQRLESVGRLAGGVAHDFNNVLTVILFHAGILEAESPEASSQREDAGTIREAAERAAALTRQLLAFSRRQTIQPEVIDLNDTVRSMEKMLRSLTGEDIDLQLGLATELARVKADVTQIEQVIMNLVVNARDAMPQGGRLVIETRNMRVDDEEAGRRPPMQPGEYVALTVTDTGIGMDEETLSHVFEPFFTTKEFGKGTGLGLSTVYGIVKQSAGFIWIDSLPGRGTSVRIHLPCAAEQAVATPPSPRRGADQRGHGETVLVVEDDDMVRKLARRILERGGYKVLEASSGPEALLLSSRFTDSIDLLLTDVIMPGVDGRELARRMRGTRPAMKVVFTSGYTDEVIAHRGVLNPGVSLVQKPFSADSLLRLIREVLVGVRPGGIGGSDSP